MPRERAFLLAFIALTLLYAGVAGLRTVGDADLGWQLATGQYVVEHGRIPSQDVFSHTARGREWIYPPFSGAFFYIAYLAGGFELLSWIGAAACVATVAVLLLGGGSFGARLGTACLAILATPFIAGRTKPRSDLFSTFLFAAILVILWRHYRERRSPLWLLPVLMFAWANLHLGFAAALALFAAYAGMELLELPFAARRSSAAARLRRAAPWLAAATAATVINPWGPRLYAALVRQNRILESLEGYVGEWFPVRLSWLTAREMLDWRQPDAGFYWLMLLGIAGAGLAAWRRWPGPALLLAGTLLGSIRYVRFQVLFAMAAVVVASEVLAGSGGKKAAPLAASGAEAAPVAGSGGGKAPSLTGRRLYALGGMGLLMLVLVGVRVADLVSNRYYLSIPDNVSFGAGASWWLPARAASFVLRERLPGQIINDYNIGGYLSWRFGPQHPVSVDNRAVPFGPDIFFLHKRLLAEPPDSPLWQEQAERWGINTLIVSISRYGGMSNFPVRSFCASRAWRPVYIDEVAAVFLRNRPENEPWLRRLEIDCATVRLAPPALSMRRAEVYNFHANAGWVLFGLGRETEALAALERAESIFDADPQLHLIKGSVLQAGGRIGEAEAQYRRALALRASDQAWYALGQAQAMQGRYGEAVEAISRAARYALFPHEIYRVLADVYLAMNQPRQALAALDSAARHNPHRGKSAALGAGFESQVVAARARAWQRLGDLGRAVSFQEQAVKHAPDDPAQWLELARLYQAQGRGADAQQALSRAEALRSR